MTDSKQTLQDKESSEPEFLSEEAKKYGKHGNWPEVFGVLLTLFLCWLTFELTG